MKKTNEKVAKALELIVQDVATKKPLEVVINIEKNNANSLFDVQVWMHINERKNAIIGKIKDNAKTVLLIDIWDTTFNAA